MSVKFTVYTASCANRSCVLYIDNKFLTYATNGILWTGVSLYVWKVLNCSHECIRTNLGIGLPYNIIDQSSRKAQ